MVGYLLLSSAEAERSTYGGSQTWVQALPYLVCGALLWVKQAKHWLEWVLWLGLRGSRGVGDCREGI